MHVPQEAVPSRTLRNCAVCCAACRLVQLEDAGVDGAGGVKCGRAVQVQRGVRKHIGEEGVRIEDAYAELDACWRESNDRVFKHTNVRVWERRGESLEHQLGQEVP